MANRKTTVLFTACGILVGMILGAWLDWHAYLGNPTRPHTVIPPPIRFDVQEFGEGSVVVGAGDTLQMSRNGYKDDNLKMHFVGDSTPCEKNANDVSTCNVSALGMESQKFYLFSCKDVGPDGYSCPDPGVSHSSTDGTMIDPEKGLTDFLKALHLDLLCIFGCNLHEFLQLSETHAAPAVTAPGGQSAPAGSKERTKPKLKGAVASSPNSYAYVYCNNKITQVQPMHPEGTPTDPVSVVTGQNFYWVGNDPFTVLNFQNPSDVCQASSISAGNNMGLYEVKCSVANSPKLSSYTYQIVDGACSGNSTFNGTINILR